MRATADAADPEASYRTFRDQPRNIVYRPIDAAWISLRILSILRKLSRNRPVAVFAQSTRRHLLLRTLGQTLRVPLDTGAE